MRLLLRSAALLVLLPAAAAAGVDSGESPVRRHAETFFTTDVDTTISYYDCGDVHIHKTNESRPQAETDGRIPSPRTVGPYGCSVWFSFNPKYAFNLEEGLRIRFFVDCAVPTPQYRGYWVMVYRNSPETLVRNETIPRTPPRMCSGVEEVEGEVVRKNITFQESESMLLRIVFFHTNPTADLSQTVHLLLGSRTHPSGLRIGNGTQPPSAPVPAPTDANPGGRAAAPSLAAALGAVLVALACLRHAGDPRR